MMLLSATSEKKALTAKSEKHVLAPNALNAELTALKLENVVLFFVDELLVLPSGVTSDAVGSSRA